MSAIDPTAYTCPACQAKPGERCTQPTDTGRREVKRVHLARESVWADVLEDKAADR